MNFSRVKLLNSRIPVQFKSNGVFNFFYRIFLCSIGDYRRELVKHSNLILKEHSDLDYKTVRKGMIDSFISSGFNPFEYRCYHLYEKSEKERNQYMARYESYNILRNPSINILPDDKYNRFNLFRQFFKRDVIVLKYIEDGAEKVLFDSFKNKHNEAIIKPLHGSKGVGVQKVKLESYSSYYHFRREICLPCLVEQVIVQGTELAVFHPESINTVRVVTCINKKGVFSILWTLFRTGCGESVVDNVGSGGIISLVDSTGVIVSDGMRADHYYTVHPDSGIRFCGYQIPDWNSLCELAEKAHRTMPNQCVFGWDFAWSDAGWELVEVNSSPAPDSYQILAKTGIRPIFEAVGIL